MDPVDPTPVAHVRLRLLPWRPRWRTGQGGPATDLGTSLSSAGGDDPISAFLGLVGLVLLIPLLVAVLLGVAVLSVEMLALLPLGLLLLVGRASHLQPWVLVVRLTDGRQRLERVTGWRAVRARQRELQAMRVHSRPSGRADHGR